MTQTIQTTKKLSNPKKLSEIGGVDFVNVLSKAMGLPTVKASGMTRAPHMTISHSKVKDCTSGRAWPSQNRIHLTVGTDSSLEYNIGVLLHELAHIATSRYREGFKDGSRQFARRCHDIHDEWNARWGSRVGRACIHLTGCYAGISNRLDWRKATVPARKPAEVLAAAAKSAPVHRITADNVAGKHWWKLAMEVHAGKEVKISLPGTLATELECRYVDTVEEDSAEDRRWFAETFWAGRWRKAGKGHQRVIMMPAEKLMVLHDAIEWAVWEYDDEPTAARQAAQVLSRLVNVKES